MADLTNGDTIDNNSRGITAFTIPKGNGLTNQEAQAVDQDGGVHVLNRCTWKAKPTWRHYYRNTNGGLEPFSSAPVPW